MQNKPLPILKVTIHSPSCKSKGFLSECFAEEIKKCIPSYKFEFDFTNSPNAFFPNGVSIFSAENISNEESENLYKKFQNIFFNLSIKQTG